MKAIIQTQYGSPDVLKLEEVAKPVPAADEVLIKIVGASANAADWHLLRGTPFFFRFDSGLLKPKNPIIGNDVAGTIEAVGANVTDFKVGDRVFGETSRTGFGGYAQYVCTRPEFLAHAPENIELAEAGALPVAGITALQSVQKADIQPGQPVLINGASGSVGTFTVQIAKARGAEVTAVCSTAKVEQSQAIGADHVIDYKKEDFRQKGQKYDVVIDNVGNMTAADYLKVLNEGGKGVQIGFDGLGKMATFAIQSRGASKRINGWIGMMGPASPNQKDLTELKNLVEVGAVKPIIEKRYTLSEVPEAIRYIETGHVHGKLLIEVNGH